MAQKTKKQKKERRHIRIRARIFGTETRPRLHVFRSNKHWYLQLINDETGKILGAVSDLKMKKSPGSERAKELARSIVQKAKEQHIVKIVFDRGGYKYHGGVKLVAESIRAEGLEF